MDKVDESTFVEVRLIRGGRVIHNAIQVVPELEGHFTPIELNSQHFERYSNEDKHWILATEVHIVETPIP